MDVGRTDFLASREAARERGGRLNGTSMTLEWTLNGTSMWIEFRALISANGRTQQAVDAYGS